MVVDHRAHNKGVVDKITKNIAVGFQKKVIKVLDEKRIPAEINPDKNIKKSIKISFNADGSVFVGSDLIYARPLEFGSRPHYVPFEPLYAWVKKKLKIEDDNEARRVTVAIQDHIAQHGTKATRFMRVSLEEFIRGV